MARAPIAWRPDPEVAGKTRIVSFLRRHGLQDLQALNSRAASDPEWFWKTVVQEEIGLQFKRPPRMWVDTSKGLAWTRFFVGATLNLEESLLDRHATGRPDEVALVWEGEPGEIRQFTYKEMKEKVSACRAGLSRLGVGEGDAVGVFMPMLPETIVAVLALAGMGAVLVPIFSGYGPEATATRLLDASVKVLLTADGFYRRGRPVDMLSVARHAKELSPSVETMVVCRRLGEPRLTGGERDWQETLEGLAPTKTPELSAQAPLMIIYTSGTTGKPKGAVHVQTGFPLKAAQDLAHAFDLNPRDRLFWYTDMGWMMGPWAVYGAFLLGASLVIYEGTPDHPFPDRLWDLVERHQVTHFGISPTAIRSLMGHGPQWPRKKDLSSLRILGSTGEPWNMDPWTWFLEEIGRGKCPIINYSGGTEISGGILSGFPHLPQKPCSFQGPLPGMQVEILNDSGEAVVGEVGEMAIRFPWVGMTRGFHNDPERYLETYWSRFKDVWVHGDFALVTDDGSWYILGRSDDTIKVAGKRLGPAEAESAAVAHGSVGEAVAIGVPHALKGEALVVFVVLRPGHLPSEELRGEIREKITQHLGKPLQPEKILFVSDIPRTRNGKIVRRAVRARYLGLPQGDLSSVENPASLDAIDAAH